MTDTLIELVRVIDGKAPLWPLHRWRIMNSALILGVPLPDIKVPKGSDRVVRIEITDGGVSITDQEVPPAKAVSLASSPAPHRGYRHKVASRAWLEAACVTGRATGADDALLFDAEGRLVEATRWAVGWWDGDTLCFPPLALGGLPSVARARITEMARGGLREAVLTRNELARRDFLVCNAMQGIASVEMLDETPIRENPRTVALARRFWYRPDA